MPEIKNTFTSGKMNKDLDERIVPKNEYRDALNIDVATTEGSDIGSAQNSFGNLKVSALGVVGAKCIGSTLNPENQKVIWFVSGTSIDLIAEFDQAADSIVPILVDNHGGSDSFLNFKNDHLITGINVIDGMLFWTDNNSEPKKINIDRFKQGVAASSIFSTTTKFVEQQGDGALVKTTFDVLEKHITVIKKYPLSAPKISLFRDSGGSTEPSLTTLTHPQKTSRNGQGNPFAAGSTNSVAQYNTTTLRATSADINSTTVTFDSGTLNQVQWNDVVVGMTFTDDTGATPSTHKDSNGNVIGVDAVSTNSVTLSAAPNSTIASGTTVGFRRALSNYQNASFWTYKDSDNVTQVKPAGTLSNDSMYEKDINDNLIPIVDVNGVDIRIQKLVFSPRPNYKEGDIVVLQTENTLTTDPEDVVKVRLRLLAEDVGFMIDSTHGVLSPTSFRKVFDVKILSISPQIALMPAADCDSWTVSKETDTAIFEDKFARFAFRWKYIDGEYSCISPFTPVAFLPTEEGYELNSEVGYNKNMVNSVSKITLSDFNKIPDGVVELEVLCKFSDSPNIHKFKTVNSSDLASFTSLDITSDQLNAMLPSNQLLRAYDNVPRTAKAQEITANRLLYGNYTQQYDLANENPVFELMMESASLDANIGTAAKSIKSLRTYQAGVALLDKYGRQTPVFSPSWANPSVSRVKVSRDNSYTANSFFVAHDFTVPSWSTHLKFYIKEPKKEYYNITMDRIYQNINEDFAWVSFPSSDINKVQEGDIIVLKKSHDGVKKIEANKNPKYKVLSIEKNAPDAIKVKRKLLGRLENQGFATDSDNTTGYPVQGGIVVRIRGNQGINLNEAIKSSSDTTSEARYIRIGSYLKNTVSDFYEVDSITKTDTNTDGDFLDGDDYWEFTLKKPFNADINFMFGAPGSSTRAEYFELYEDQAKEFDEEFQGKFFIKILKDDILQEHVINANSSSGLVYAIKSTEKIYWIQNLFTGSGGNQETGFAPGADTTAPFNLLTDTTHDNSSGSNIFGNDTATHLMTTYNGTFPSEETLEEDPNFWQEDGSNTGDIVYGVVYRDWSYRGHAAIRTVINGRDNGVQRYAIDQAWAWKQWSSKGSLSKHNGDNHDMQMGRGFRLGERECNFRLFNMGPGVTIDPDEPGGFSFDRPFGPRRSLIENNFTLFKALGTVGTKFRWSDDPSGDDGNGTIYTVVSSDLLDVNNYTNKGGQNHDPDFHKRSNQGVRWRLRLDKPIEWSPTSHVLSDGTSTIVDSSGTTVFDQMAKRITPYDGRAKSDPENASAAIIAGTDPDSPGAAWTPEEQEPNTSELQILVPITDTDTFASTSPAVFEVQPQESSDLNLFHETPSSVLIIKDDMYIEEDVVKPDGTIETGVFDANSQITTVSDNIMEAAFVIKDTSPFSKQNKHIIPGTTLTVYTKDANGNVEHKQKIISTQITCAPGNYTGGIGCFLAPEMPRQNIYYKIPLDWSNCYSYGNGVESNRIRDDFNAPTIDMGPRVSTTFEDTYAEETLGSGIIYSGIFNSKSGVNNLNQFIQAEKITKDLNPSYGTIQKLYTRNTNVIAFCEHKTLRILANKDAMFNADGKPQLLSTNSVLGQAVPFAGEFGISKNPESFASYGYRVYFADKNRNAVLRLSNDGLTNVADYGMSTYFKENLSDADNIIGSYDEDKDTYNLTFNGVTVSFSDRINGWTSFKSFIPESGFSVSGDYYTVFNGDLYQHNASSLRNNFYGVQYESSIKFVFNDGPSIIKSFKGLNYEGTTSRAYQSDNDDLTLIANGWYANKIQTDKQNGKIPEFKEKEGKWFNFIQGTNNIIANLDPQEFSVQGLGVCSAVTVTSGSHDVLYQQAIRIFSPSSSPTLSLVGGVYGFSGSNSYPTSEFGNPAAIGQTHVNSGFTLNSAVKITGTAIAGIQYLRNIVSNLTPGETYTLSATVTITSNPDSKTMGFAQRSGVSVNARRTTTGVISETFVATNSQIDLFKGGNVVGNIDNISIAKTNSDEERYPKYIINNSNSNPTKTTKEIIVNRPAGTISSENQYFYVHANVVNGQKWSVKASDTTVAESSDPNSLMGTIVKEDGYISNGSWTASSAHQGLHTNVVRLSVPISGTMPSYSIVSLLKAVVIPNLTQIT
tara:strand:+ start:2241 stop:8627 length:6387 start_codon:yes stop_codon:yes gene_type:complete